MIEVEVDSIRVSLMNQNRVVVLKDINEERYLPIWIGQSEADAITLELQESRTLKRPMTHDLLKNVIEDLGATIEHIYINDMRRDIYYARIVVNLEDGQREIDARPSDAIAVAVRAKVAIFVSEAVMDKNSVVPEDDVDLDAEEDEIEFGGNLPSVPSSDASDDLLDEQEDEQEAVDESQLGAFADFVNSLDLDELDESDDK